LRSNGFSFAIVRAGLSTGHIDPNAPATVANAWDGGMLHVDVYLFPCPTCGDAAGQVRQVVENLSAHKTRYGMLWLDIEGPQYWTSSQATNRAFFTALVNEAEALGVQLGIYSSASQWDPIFGNWDGASKYPLWYAHYDGAANFNDFGSFGGWSKPAIKQYAGSTNECGCGIDKNWYP